jgi:beta-phosphoglucomutase
MGIQAFLFDLDGTLIDSMPLHHRAWQQWFAGIGMPFDETTFFERTAGRTNAEILADLFPSRSPDERDAMADAKESLYRVIAARELSTIPGALAFLGQAKQRGLAAAICTAAPLDNINVAFQRFDLRDQVQAVTSPADGLRGKPHPDIFLEAARRLNVAAADCIVFEDAPLGVEAARRAGMRAVALTTSLPAAAFAEFPNLVCAVTNFTTLAFNELLDLPGIHHA